MLKAARWAVLGLLGVSILVLAFAVGYVVRGDGSSAVAATGDALGTRTTALRRPTSRT